MTFVLSEVFTEWEKNLSELLEISYTDLPCLYVIDPRNLPEIKKYKLQKDINEANVLEFVSEWIEGKLKPLLKSDEIPPEDSSSIVKEIVGKNYENIVLQEGIDVLVYFYASHCENCIEFEPKYIQLAEAMMSNKSILFTKIDANKNEIEGVVLEFLPAIFLYSKNDKPKYQKYEGSKYTFEDLALWINQHLSKTETKKDL